MLFEKPSAIPSASIAVDACFQLRKQLCFRISWLIDFDLWHTAQYRFLMPTNKTLPVLYPIIVA